MNRNRKLATIALATVAAAVVIPATAFAATTSDMQIKLQAGTSLPRAHGSAQYQTQPGQREFQVEIGRLRSLAGHTVLVQVNGTNVGTAKVSKTGIVEFIRNTELGQSVPAVTHGSTVTVTTGAAGTLVASGVF